MRHHGLEVAIGFGQINSQPVLAFQQAIVAVAGGWGVGKIGIVRDGLQMIYMQQPNAVFPIFRAL